MFGSAKTARTIVLSHETPVFNSIVIDSKNTLMTSNWFTKIQATTVTVKSGERVISVLVVTAGIKQEEKATANLTLKVDESITYTTFSKSTAWTAKSASTTYVTASVQNPTADEPEFALSLPLPPMRGECPAV